jgi:hypothetical protein
MKFLHYPSDHLRLQLLWRNTSDGTTAYIGGSFGVWCASYAPLAIRQRIFQIAHACPEPQKSRQRLVPIHLTFSKSSLPDRLSSQAVVS